MNLDNIFQAYQAGKDAYKVANKAAKKGKKLQDKLVHDGKENVGEVLLRDSSYRQWEVKVRITGNRGKYLKIKSELTGDEIFASANNYKIGKYISITPEEWEVFARCTENSDEELRNRAKKILNRLVK